MTGPSAEGDESALLERLTAGGGRVLLGMTGPPGVGKSTYAATLVESWQVGQRSAAIVGLDGFHLSNETLAARGLADVKGAPETFDVDGFVALLRRLRDAAGGSAVPVPGFDRAREQTVPAATTVPAGVELVVVEGNYLLLDGPWRPVRDLLDACWFLDLPDDVRVARLVDRHVAHGRTPAQAAEWVQRSDEANARLIAATRSRADAVVDVGTGRPSTP